jgi:hypothetical protein
LLSTQPRKVKLFSDIPSVIREKSRLVEGQSKIPVVPQISQESRAEGSRFYAMCKERITGETGGIAEWTNYVYVNFDVDHFSHSVSYRADGLCQSFSQVNKIKFIDANYYGTSVGREEVEFNDVVLMILTGIKSLVNFRFVITSNNYKKNSSGGRLSDETLMGTCCCVLGAKDLLSALRLRPNRCWTQFEKCKSHRGESQMKIGSRKWVLCMLKKYPKMRCGIMPSKIWTVCLARR